jgi:hypothetical protein
MIFSENRFPLFRIMLGCASLYTEDRKKAGKFVVMALLCAAKAVRLRSIRGCDAIAAPDADHPIKGNTMGGSGKESKPLKPVDDKAKKPPPPTEDDEFEDGDIATPKRDRCGDDDEPL